MEEKLPFMPYCVGHKMYARYHRKHPTPAEQKLWEEVLRRDQLGYRFLRQKLLAGFIADFYCAKLRLVIEVDGGIHEFQKEYDAERTRILESMGIKVRRCHNEEVLLQIDLVREEIRRVISERAVAIWVG